MNYHTKGSFLRAINIFFAVVYMVVYTTPYFRYVLGDRFRVVGLGLLALWMITSLFRVVPRYLSRFSLFVICNIVAFVLMSIAGMGNVSEILAGYIAFWSFAIIFEMYLVLGDDSAIRTITICLIIVICFTGVTSIIASVTYPNISKNTYRSTTTGENIANMLNVGGFDYIAGMSVLTPILFYLARKRKKVFFWGSGIICALTVAVSGFAIDFIAMLLGFLLLVFSDKNAKMRFERAIPFSIVLFLAIVLMQESVSIAQWVSTWNEHLANRLLELQNYLNGDLEEGTDLAYRIELIGRSFQVFMNHFFVGVGPYYFVGTGGLGNHCQIIDDFGRFGMIAFLFYAAFWSTMRQWLRSIRERTGSVYSESVPYLVFVFISFLNPTLILPILGLVLFFVLPGIYFVTAEMDDYLQ